MREEVFEIIKSLKPAVLTYEGTDLLSDEVLESADIMDIVIALEDHFGFEVPPELIIPEYFMTKESILSLAEAAKEA